MKKLISFVLMFTLFASSAFADCDFSTGIKSNPDGTYNYSKECHIKVGQIVQDNATKDAQIADYKKALTLKDLTITTDEQRINNFAVALDRTMARVDKADELRDRNYWLYFGLGVLVTGAAAYSAAKLSGR